MALETPGELSFKMTNWTIEFLFPAVVADFSFGHHIHPTSYPMYTMGSFPVR